MDHHSLDCLPAEKFPTFASGRQGRGPATLLNFRRLFPRAMLLGKNHRRTGVDLRDELIRLRILLGPIDLQRLPLQLGPTTNSLWTVCIKL